MVMTMQLNHADGPSHRQSLHAHDLLLHFQSTRVKDSIAERVSHFEHQRISDLQLKGKNGRLVSRQFLCLT